MKRAALALAAVAALATAASAAGGEGVTTAADRRGVAVTIYNAGIALVRDRRRITVPAGESRLALRDVSDNMLPETAALRSLGASSAFDVVEQNFEASLLTPQAVLHANVGRTVTVTHVDRRTHARRRERATILAANGGVVLRYADRIETSVDGPIAFAPGERGLRERPTLVATVDAPRAMTADAELDYLTAGLQWSAQYTALLLSDGEHADLHGDVTVVNRSGTAYVNANVQLVAGDVHVVRNPRAPQPLPAPLQVIGRATSRTSAFEEQPLFDYHLYTLPRRATLADAQSKQLALLDAPRVPIRRTLELRGNGPVAVYATLRNVEPQLGMPLPAGSIRFYQRDSRGTAQYIGAGRIDHTPRGEAIRLRLGTAANLTTATTRLATVRIGPSEFEYTDRVTLSNARSSAREVLVVEPFSGDWQIVESSLPFRKTSAATAEWTVHVLANETVSLTYRWHTRS
ncbi:MAG: hypothetical protein JWM87_1635 [Candidatus Eremiobacteraeota bacterium]|nr:hypothetical protein [Candidatus Eremiobacteraeota bacterium]